VKTADVEKFLLSLPGATLSIQWGDDRVFKVGGKMFAVMGPNDPKRTGLSFKAGEESFHILTRAKHIVPAPYLARAHWVMLERLNALNAKELKAYLTRAHAIVAAGLTKKKRAELGMPS
jgi:predicted DNA-binding protein (MmcQ/YjbR family)